MSTATRAPSSFRVQEAVTLLSQARDMLLADEALAGDQDLMADYLASDPATCDAMDVVNALARAVISTEDMAAAAKQRATEIAERGKRFKARADGLRNTLKTVMEILDIRRISQPDLSATIARGTAGVVVLDASLLADRFVKIERTPMKKEIGAALDSGEEVAGAVRGNPEPQLRIIRS